jgi:pimeloyl-ACP methyl ester carboxylesterase
MKPSKLVGDGVMKKNVIFLHGFASSGMGTKSVYLNGQFRDREEVDFRAFEFTPTPKDFEYMTATGMVGRLRQFVLREELTPFFLIGSSFGALIGMNYAARFGGVDGALLLAPALRYTTMAKDEDERERWSVQGFLDVLHYSFNKTLPLRYELEIDGQLYLDAPAPNGPVTIVHGSGDEVVPVEESRRYAREYPSLVTLVEVDAGHDLNDHLELIGELVEEGIG